MRSISRRLSIVQDQVVLSSTESVGGKPLFSSKDGYDLPSKTKMPISSGNDFLVQTNYTHDAGGSYHGYPGL